jgi:protein-L-isoaspartate O-methyltransferase
VSFSATYSPDDNKLRLYAATRLDQETYARVRDAGFIWAPKQKLFVAPKWTPQREDLLVELAGEIGDEDTSLVDRAEERAERFENYSEKRGAESQGALSAVSAIADNIPLGQPILVGHHSEKRARKDAERIQNGMRKAVDLWKTSKYWTSRAAGAIGHAKYKERPDVRARRIKTLEAERRSWERATKEGEKLSAAWVGLSDPESMKRDGQPISFAERVKYAADRGFGCRFELARELDEGKISPEDAQASVIAGHARNAVRFARWIAHLDNRLAYERAMLDASGWVPPPPPKTKASLPLLNYPGEVAYRNPYHIGQIERETAVGMTKEKLASIPNDYKGTRVSEDGTHRVRYALVGPGHAYSVVFLTDSKVHDRPGEDARRSVAEAEDQAAAEREADLDDRAKRQIAGADERHARQEREAAADAPFKAVEAALKGGVQVVSAPQLFPTPPELARRMVEKAQLEPGLCVLEPSGGTGAIIQAVLDAVDTEVMTYEINATLCAALSRKFPGYKVQARCADFLTVTDFAGCYPRILMNPPFANGQDIVHVLHALTMLAPGGRLVAIVADGPRQNDRLRPIVEERGGIWESLPAGTFESSGTGVRTALIVVDAEAAS